MENKQIVFYDGDCGLCNRTVQFVLRKDKFARIYFSALQSEFTQNFFSERKLKVPDLSTFYFYDGKEMHERSTGVLQLMKFLPFPWNWSVAALIIPRIIRDGVYNMIAKRRKFLVGSFCIVPTTAQKNRFLD
jgi:predicted DCC family thiol-disulfide oxidoreductase YuxK